MKKLLLITLLIPSLAKSQLRDTTNMYKVGTELIKYERQYSSGVMLQLGGLGLALAGSATQTNSNNKNVKTPLIISGGFLSLIGFVMQISSASHIKKAGILLRGDKIIIPIKSSFTKHSRK